MDSKSEINLERAIHAWVFNGKSLSTRSLKLGELLFSVKNQHFTAILERVELCASGSHPIQRLTHCGLIRAKGLELEKPADPTRKNGSDTEPK